MPVIIFIFVLKIFFFQHMHMCITLIFYFVNPLYLLFVGFVKKVGNNDVINWIINVCFTGLFGKFQNLFSFFLFCLCVMCFIYKYYFWSFFLLMSWLDNRVNHKEDSKSWMDNLLWTISVPLLIFLVMPLNFMILPTLLLNFESSHIVSWILNQSPCFLLFKIVCILFQNMFEAKKFNNSLFKSYFFNFMLIKLIYLSPLNSLDVLT